MKKFNIILLVLCCLTSVGYAQVAVGNKAEPEEGIQSKGYLPGNGYTFQRGDTIIIKQDAINYLTGEKMSDWVYTVRHLVEKQGGKRFPDGVLVQGIISWVPAKDLYLCTPVNGEAQMGQNGENQSGTNAGAEVQTKLVRDTLYINREIHDTAYVHDTVRVKFNTRYGINRFSIGVRGGLASLMHNTNVMKDNLGFDAYLDLQYAHYWKQGDKAGVGLLVGASFGYLRSGLHSELNDRYNVMTSGGNVQYRITAKEVKEVQEEVVAEVPLMLSIVADNGFFFNVGPKVSFPIWSASKLTFNDPHVNAYMTDYVPNPDLDSRWSIEDKVIMGKLDESAQKSVTNWKHPLLNVLIGAELGYEFPMKSGNSLGLGLYGNYGVYSLYEGVNANSFINITPPTETSAAVVKVESPSDTYTNKMGMFDVGVKLTYHIQWKKLTL